MGNEKKATIHKHILNLSYDTTTLSQYEDFRIYKNATILTPGEWTDCITRSPVVYSESELEKNATNWKENYLDLDHSFSVSDRVGYVRNPHADKGCVKADLYILKGTHSGDDVIRKIDCGLITDVSAELTTNDRYDYGSGKYIAEDLCFMGCAIVTHGAADGASIHK